MVMRRMMVALLAAGGLVVAGAGDCSAQCCLEGLFAGCGSCFRKAPPAYAVAPMMAPVAAPIAAPPPPVMVPVQQVSYVPETTYQTKYECVPVTAYKPSCEIDPCTGCPRECMEQVVNYQQRPVSVPVTQYRAVYSTKYVQMQPGYGAPAAYPAPAASSPPPAFSAPAPAAVSPFAAPVQTGPQGWAAAGADVPQQLIPSQPAMTAPAMPPASVPQPTYQQPTYQQPTYQQQIVPQSGMYPPATSSQAQLQPTAPPALSPAPAPVTPTPSLKPIPEMPRSTPQNDGKTPGTGAGSAAAGQPAAPAPSASSLSPVHPSAVPAAGSVPAVGMPVMPGPGPGPATGAFPKLLEPTGHTTSHRPLPSAATQWQAVGAAPSSWQPFPVQAAGAYASGQRFGGYPTAALPIRSQQ